jgi:hypothetical protein
VSLSSHIFIEASAHLLAVTPTAHWLEYLDFAGAILAEPHRAVDGSVTAKGLFSSRMKALSHASPLCLLFFIGENFD